MSAEYDDLRSAKLNHVWTSAHEARLQTYLAEHPEARSLWQEDLCLERFLGHLPNAPIASNFTAQVLSALSGRKTFRRFPFLGFGWRFKWAFAPATLLVAALVAYQQVRAVSRHELAKGITTVSDVAVLLAPTPVLDSKGQPIEFPPLPGLDILQDFNAIARLNTMSQAVDLDLLLALQ